MNDKWTPRKIEKSKKKHRWTIDDKSSCENAIRSGVLVGCLLSSITFGLVTYNYLVGFASEALSNAATTDALFDVVLFLVLSFFTSRKSRVASTFLFILYVLEFISKFSEGNTPHGILLIWDLMMLACFANACRATFLWHMRYKHEKADNSTIAISN